MKQLEDRIKDRLEGYESSLPEGDLAEFKALLGAPDATEKSKSPVYFAWLASVAVVAALALFFVLGYGPEEDVIQVVDGREPVEVFVAQVVDTPIADVDVITVKENVEQSKIARSRPAASKTIACYDDKVAVNEKSENHESMTGHFEQIEADNVESGPQAVGTEQTDEYSPMVPSGSNIRKPVSLKVGAATAGVVGGAGALALASVLPSSQKGDIGGVLDTPSPPVDEDYDFVPDPDPNPKPNPNPDPKPEPEPVIDSRTGENTHYMPLCVGLSFRTRFNDRWSLTTGLEYSWYVSKLDYSLSGMHTQSVHYLGIPLRADFTLARNRWMDVYVGAGGSVDFCIAAFDAGQKISGDGIGFSLIAAGGIQFNINKNFGFFLDPTLSWNIPSKNRNLDTYRSVHPFMFKVSTGLRVTFCEK